MLISPQNYIHAGFKFTGHQVLAMGRISFQVNVQSCMCWWLDIYFFMSYSGHTLANNVCKMITRGC
jgi:hypothetical protein